ncbi:MAG TPA: metallophosphoesterase [Deferrisomatales bacterium]|nr:metallophosphoesterase [Deferrisomatales bacterium]
MRLFLFILIAVSVLTAMHAVVFWGVHPLVAGRPRVPAVILGWMGVMILAPLAVPLLERAGHELAARSLAWVAYSWLGLIFLAFSLFSALGVWELLAWLVANGLPGLPQVSAYGPRTAALGLAAALGAGFYGFSEARQLRVETLHLTTAKLGAGRDGLRVVQVSDLHLGLLNREGVLQRVVSRIKELGPDLLVATGDVVDAQLDHLNGLSDLWRGVDPPLGKYAVTGNHEVYAGLSQSLEFLTRSGFTVLRNESRNVGGILTLTGVDDDHVQGSRSDEAALLRAQPQGRYTVLLKHRPSVAPDSAGRFDLQLSGHTHLGQIFPFRFLTGLQYPRQNGLYDLPGGAKLYTSRGTGTWGPPMRVLAPPEITVFEVRLSGSRENR